MILGTSAFVYRVDASSLGFEAKGAEVIDEVKKYPIFISYNYLKELKNSISILTEFNEKLKLVLQGYFKAKLVRVDVKPKQVHRLHVDVSFVNGSDELDIEAFKNYPLNIDYKHAIFLTEKDKTYKVSREVEKMSKSKYNVVSPDAICHQYGADSLRMYEMFLGPLEQAKPWNTAGITGVHSFLKKMWKLYHNGDVFSVSDKEPTNEQYKILHKTIKKVEEDIENFSFNTSVSTFMIAVNELTAQQCNSRKILEPLLVLISPYAPHIAEELWHKLGPSGINCYGTVPCI